MKKKWVLAMTLIFALLTGCGEGVEGRGDGQGIETDPPDTAPAVSEETPVVYSGDSSAVLEDDKAVYICGTGQIRKVDKDSQEVTVLWESGTEEMDMLSYGGGQAVLAGDKLYFIEHVRVAYEEKEILSMIDTDGTGYEKIDELENPFHTMYCSDQALYVYCLWNLVRAYEIGEDGGLSFSEELTENMPYKIPEDYSMIGALTPFESVENYGYILLRDKNLKAVMIDPQTKAETLFGEDIIENWNRDYILCLSYNEAGGKELYLKDAQTLETRMLTCLDSEYNGWILGLDDKYVYAVRYQDDKEDHGYIYERIALENGERSSFFTIHVGIEPHPLSQAMGFVICNGYVYYIAEKDYAMYLARRSTEDIDTEEILGEAYFDKEIGKVGVLETYYEPIYSEISPDAIRGEVTYQSIVVDEKFAGASKINRTLSSFLEECISYEKDSTKWIDDELEEKGGDVRDMLGLFSNTSYPSAITYFDGNYFSFCQHGDAYEGGAHGMLYQIGYTFDLETGERIYLADLIGNSEEELRELVAEYFAQYIGENPEAFWEDALETVNEGVSLDSDFYLSKEGIHFYFPPYALACFAAGFQEVTIPYEEFDMKLPLGMKQMAAEEADSGDEDGKSENGDETPADLTTADHDVNGRKLPIYCVDTQEKKIALTFDAAWGNEDTEEILEILEKHDVHVTFFMTGGWVESYPEDVKNILAAGHDLGNHSENHKNMSQLSDDEKREEIMKVHEKVKNLTGYDMFLFRPPYGDYDNAVVDVLKDCGYYGIQWDVDSLDWQNKGIDSIIETVTEHKNLGNGSIILCHNGAEYTAAVLDDLITALEGEGYEIVPLSELIYKDHYHLNFEGRQIKN